MDNNAKAPGKWYFRSSSLIIGFLIAGPLILPLLWSNPCFSNKKKIVISVAIATLSALLFIMTAGSLKTINDFY